MKIAIRVDASLQIGTGHVMRCLTLAETLQRKGARIIFICREHPGHLCKHIEEKGFQLYRFPLSVQKESNNSQIDMANSSSCASWLGVSWKKDADETINVLLQEEISCLIVDHFGIDASWERRVKNHAPANLAVIDGQLDRPHECDFLLDPNLTCKAAERWKNLVPPHCKLFLGPRFAFLRPEFLEERSRLRRRDGHVQNILIAFGGVDKNNATGMALTALKHVDLSGIVVNVVAGVGNPYMADLERASRFHAKMNYHAQSFDMAKLMAVADLCLGAGGTMAWERCYMGLPSIMISIADNQIDNCRSLAREGAALYLGRQQEVQVRKIVGSINFAFTNPQELRKIGEKCIHLMGEPASGMHEFCQAILR